MWRAPGIMKEVKRLLRSNNDANALVDCKLLTEFSSDMFAETQNSPLVDYHHQPPSYPIQNLSKSAIESRLKGLEIELADLKMRRQQQELEIENFALRQKSSDILDKLLLELFKHAN